MLRVRRINIKRSEKILEKLKDWAARLKQELPIEAIYLYGSFARGDFHEGSDIDLVIVGDFKERFFDRIGRILGLSDLPIEPLVYTREEFDQMVKSDNPFILEVIRTGKNL